MDGSTSSQKRDLLTKKGGILNDHIISEGQPYLMENLVPQAYSPLLHSISNAIRQQLTRIRLKKNQRCSVRQVNHLFRLRASLQELEQRRRRVRRRGSFRNQHSLRKSSSLSTLIAREALLHTSIKHKSKCKYQLSHRIQIITLSCLIRQARV